MPAADPDPAGCDFEIQPGAFVPREAFGGKVRRDVRLERLLVRAEARIAINPVERHTRIRDELGRERRQVIRQASEQLDHRSADVLLVLLLAAPKPVAVVVAFQRTQK